MSICLYIYVYAYIYMYIYICIYIYTSHIMFNKVIHAHMCIYNTYNVHDFYLSVNSRVYANGPYIHRVRTPEAYVNTCIHARTL